MENGPFIDGLPIRNGDFPMAMLNNQMVQRIPEETPKMARPNTSPCKIHNHGFKGDISYKWGIGSNPIPGPVTGTRKYRVTSARKYGHLGLQYGVNLTLKLAGEATRMAWKHWTILKHLNYGEILVTWFDHGKLIQPLERKSVQKVPTGKFQRISPLGTGELEWLPTHILHNITIILKVNVGNMFHSYKGHLAMLHQVRDFAKHIFGRWICLNIQPLVI